jgi:hypothetical protein
MTQCKRLLPDFSSLAHFLGIKGYEHNDVVRLAEVSPRNLQNWINRRLVERYGISGEHARSWSPGRQGRREYTGWDLGTIYIGSILIDRGLQPALAFHVAFQAIHDLLHTMRKSTTTGGTGDQVAIVKGEVSDRKIRNLETINRRQLRDLEIETEPLLVIPTGLLLVELASRMSLSRPS